MARATARLWGGSDSPGVVKQGTRRPEAPLTHNQSTFMTHSGVGISGCEEADGRRQPQATKYHGYVPSPPPPPLCTC